MGAKLGTPLERFSRSYKVDKKTGCWNWQLSLNDKGYGSFYFPPRNCIGAHTAAWELLRGSRKGLFVLHHCDNPRCCNPEHLYLGTQADNVRDRDLRKRRAPPIGSKNGRANLTEAEVLLIRADTRWPRFIAQDWRVPISTIKKILYRLTWKHI